MERSSRKKKKPPFSIARANTRESMRSRDAQCDTRERLYISGYCLWMGASYLRCHMHSYIPQANSSDPSVVNCSIIQDYVCGDARRRANESGTYSIESCSSVCCTEKLCNVHPTTAPPDNNANGNTSTAASTTVNGNGVREVQPPCLGLLLVMLAISVAMKKVNEYF